MDWRRRPPEKAKNIWARCSLEFSTLRYKLHLVKGAKVSSKNATFFLSEHYLDFKEKGMKMLDRLDEFNSFSRLDREMWLHKTIQVLFDKIDKSNPHFTLLSEAPHNHVSLGIQQISKFLNIPVIHFVNWTPIPLLCLRHVQGDRLIRYPGSSHKKLE